MTAIFIVMRFDVTPMVIWIFELPLDEEIRAVRVIRILLGLERGLVAVAIAEDRSGYVVGVKMHASPQPHIRFKKAYRDPSSFETASPRFRHDTHAADSTWLFWLERLTGSVGGLSVRLIRSCPSRQLRRTAELGDGVDAPRRHL